MNRYRHEKRGSTYRVLTHQARAQCSTGPINEDDTVTVYRDEKTGHYSVRRTQEFLDGRFKALGVAPRLKPEALQELEEYVEISGSDFTPTIALLIQWYKEWQA